MLLRRLSIASALMLSLGSSVALLTQNSVLAQTPDQPGKTTRKHKDGGLKKLNLTADQKTQIKAIRDKYKPQIEPIRQALKKDPKNKELRQQLRDLASKSKSEIRAILTPEQQNQLSQLEQNRKGKRGGHKKDGTNK